MNWGNGIIIAFLLFASFIGVLVYKSSVQKFDLVSKDYYEQELAFQEKIEGTANAGKLRDELNISREDNAIVLQFPGELKGRKLTGEAWFYYPADAGRDVKVPLDVDSTGRMVVGKSLLKKGTYTVKVSWHDDSPQYYYTIKSLSVD